MCQKSQGLIMKLEICYNQFSMSRWLFLSTLVDDNNLSADWLWADTLLLPV